MAETLAWITESDRRNILGIKRFGALPCMVSYASGQKKDGVITVSKKYRDNTVIFILQTADTDEKGRFFVHPFCVLPAKNSAGETTLAVVNAGEVLGGNKVQKYIRKQRVGFIFRKRKFTWKQDETPRIVDLYKKMKVLDHKTFEKKYC